MQARFEAALHTGLASVRCSGVAGRVESLQIRGTERTDVPDRVCDLGTMRIVANQAGLEIDAGKPRPLDCEVGDLFFSETKLQRDGFEAGAAAT
jgi:hypothetical protein